MPSRSIVTSTAVRPPALLSASALACKGSAVPCAACFRRAKPAIHNDRSGVMSVVATPACHADCAEPAAATTPNAGMAERNSRRFIGLPSSPSFRGEFRPVPDDTAHSRERAGGQLQDHERFLRYGKLALQPFRVARHEPEPGIVLGMADHHDGCVLAAATFFQPGSYQ